MNEERMRRLENLLRRDAANPLGVKFDLSGWAEPDDESLKGSELTVDDGYGSLAWSIGETRDQHPVIPMSCDTHACALGLAALDPEFQKEGLNYKLMPNGSGNTGSMIPTFEGHTAFLAGSAFFDISYEDARYLFDPDCYSGTPREAAGELFVADRIRDLINGKIDKDRHPDTKYGSDED